MPEISVVILCYKEGDYVPVFVERVKKVLEAIQLNYEIVLVGNYWSSQIGTDKTPEVVKALAIANPRIKAITLPKAGAMGWDMRTGLNAATGEKMVIIDGDGQMPPEDIVKVYNLSQTGEFDITKTHRDERYDGFMRIIISRVYNIFVRILFPKVRTRDVNSKPKLFTRRALEKLRLTSDDWFIDAEIIIRASYLGLHIGSVPTIFHSNERRQSLIGIKAIIEFIKNLILFRIQLWREAK